MGLSKFASVAKSSGAEAFEAMSYVVGANETVQNASKVGTAMKTIISRMNGLQASAKDGSIYTNKTALALKTIAGIDILDGNKELKDFNDLIIEVGEKWESLGKNEKIALAEAIAGKNQLNVFQALMDNWDTALQYQKEYKEGFMVGSAEKENARFIDSLEGRIITLKEECKELITTVVSSDMAKQMVSMATSIVSAINDIIKVLDDAGVSLPVLFSLMTTGMNSVNQMADKGKVIPFWKSFTDGANTTNSAINNVTESVEDAIEDNVQLGSSIQVVTQQADGQKGALGKVKGALGSFAKSSFASTVKSVALSSAVSLLNGALMSLASIAITKAVEGIYNYANAHKIAYDKIKDDIETTKTEIKTMNSAKDDLSKIADEYDELSKKKKKTTEEQERYAELTNQIAEIMPELKISEDENGNAILGLNGSLEKYIDNLDEAIERQKELLNAQIKRQANEARHEVGKYEDKHNLTPSETLSSPNLSITSSIVNDNPLEIDGDGIKNLEDFVEKYKKILQDRNDKVAELNAEYADNYANHAELESSIQEDAFNNMDNKNKYKGWDKLNDDVKGSMNTLFSTVNWGNEILRDDIGKQNEFYKGFDKLSKYITKSGEKGQKQLESWNDKLADANYAYQQTGDIEQYKESISGVAEELSKVTDISKEDWITSLTNQLDGSLDAEQMALNEFLKNYDKSIEDLNNGDKVAIKLKAEWEADNDYLTELTSYLEAGGIEAGIDYMVKINSGEINMDNLSPQIRQLIAGTLDGQDTMSEAESNLNMLLTTYITENGEIDEETWSLVQKAMNGELTEAEIKAGITLPDGTEVNSSLLRLVNGANREKPNLEVGVQITGDKLDDVEKKLKEILGKDEKERTVKIITALEQGDLTTFRQVLSELPKDKQVSILSYLQENGDLTAEEFKELVEGTPESVQKKIGVTVEGGKEAEDNLENIKDNTGDETQTIVTIDRNGNLTYETLKKVKETTQDDQQTITTSDNGGRQQIELANELHRKTYNDQQTIYTADKGGSSVLDTLKGICNKVYDKWQTITTTYKTKVKGKREDSGNDPLWSEYWGGNSTGGFTNVSDSPMAVSDTTAQSGEFSNIGDSPTATTGVNSGGSGLQRTGDVNSLAKNKKSFSIPAIDSLFTNKTKTTKIKVDYSNVWKSIKYGVELFQELENRITRVNNNLDLLDSKMDGAVGTKKISYLQAQVKLYKEQVKLQKEYYNSLNKEKSILVTKLKNQGFTVNSQGNLTSYEEKLIKLEKAYADAQKKADDYDVYSGKSESKKKASEKKKANLEKSAEKAKKALDNAKATTDRYLELLNTEIPNAKKEWEDMTNAIKQANDEIERLKFEDNIYKEEHAIESVNVKLERLATLTDRARIQAERYNGDKKIKYLNKESEYLKEQLKLNEQLVKQNSSEKEDYRYKLRQYGVKFDDQGNISNYGSTLNRYQNSQDYEKVKQYMDEFNELAEAQRQAQNEVESLTNEIIELGYEIENIKVENKMKPLEIELQNSEAMAKKLSNSLELVEMQIERAYGKDKLELIKKQVELNEELAKIRRGDVLTLKEERNVLQDSLEKYGFQFTTKGDIKNVSQILDLLSDTPAYDHVAQLVEDWRTLHEDEIPEAEKAVADYEEAVKQAYDSQLDITTEIEDKITEMIEDQIDKRKEAIEKQSEAVVKALEKERDAYKALREEADYQNDYKEKVDELSEISKKLEIARKDTSLANRKKIADLEKQLEEAQKELEEFVQDKIDSDVDKAYEDKIDAIEEESDKQIEALEDAWTDSKIAEAVREALQTGLFTDLDGNVKNLETAMLEFAQKSADHFSVMGQSIENDLIANLNVALDTVTNLSSIMNELGIPEVRSVVSTGELSNKYLTVNGITINVPTTSASASAVDIANEVQKAVEEALKNVTDGL